MFPWFKKTFYFPGTKNEVMVWYPLMLWYHVELQTLSNLPGYDLVDLFISWVRPKAQHISKQGFSSFDWASLNFVCFV